jgi:L-rhamnose mutarotase
MLLLRNLFSFIAITFILANCNTPEKTTHVETTETTTEKKITATKRYYLALDLKNDSALIAEYKNIHQNVWKEILDGIKAVGVLDMEIYLTGNRMFMVVVVPEDFDFDTQMGKLAQMPRQEEWEKFMWKFQEPLPHAKEGQKWMLAEKIFDFNKALN